MILERWTEAEEEITTVLSGYKKTQQPMSRDIRMTLGNLACILRNSGKDVNRAMQLYKELMIYKTKLFGPGHGYVL